jgi:hypothetical protein
VLIKAIACGLPITVTPAHGPASIVTDGRTGWLVPPEDEESRSSTHSPPQVPRNVAPVPDAHRMKAETMAGRRSRLASPPWTRNCSHPGSRSRTLRYELARRIVGLPLPSSERVTCQLGSGSSSSSSLC